MATDKQRFGAWGESLVADWYAAAGFEIVVRNWRCSEGEIDLVVRRGGLLVFCEVKTRSSLRFGHPVEAVNAAKQARLRRVARRYLVQQSPGAARIRFDVAAVLGRSVSVIEGAF